MVPPNLRGPPSLLSKQLIVHGFSPRVSVLSSTQADKCAVNYGFKSMLEMLSFFEQTLIDEDTGAAANNGVPPGLVVRFVGPIEDQLMKQKSSNAFSTPELYDEPVNVKYLDDHISRTDEAIERTEFYQTKSGSPVQASILQDTTYLKLLAQSLSSDTLAPFEYLSHPIMQLFVCTADEDPRDVGRSFLDWNQRTYPEWFDKGAVLPLFLVLADSDRPEQLQKGLRLQENLRVSVTQKALVLPVSFEKIKESTKTATLYAPPCISSGLESQLTKRTIEIPRKIFDAFNIQIRDIIFKMLAPYMLRKIRFWNDEYVVPRESITGRIGRLWGSSSSSTRSIFSFGSHETKSEKKEDDNEAYRTNGGYYKSSSTRSVIRHLADWYFMLRDYKNAYSTYELIKKDFLADKSYSHLSSVQEFMVISLLLGASAKINPLENYVTSQKGGGITSKIISDVITPLVESSSYSYLSRCNLKTYTIRLTLLVAEMYLVLGQVGANLKQSPGVSLLPPSEYFSESVHLFQKLVNSGLLDTLSCSLVMERVAYVYYCYDKPLPAQPIVGEKGSYYEQPNPDKLQLASRSGMDRKSILWMLLAARQLKSKPTQSWLMVWSVQKALEEAGFQDNDTCSPEYRWPYRDQSLLAKLLAN